MNVPAISREEIHDALARVLDGEAFRAAPLRAKFLQYVVSTALEGPANRLKGTAIAIEVYERGADFDPQTDPVVRVEARRIRRDLEHYYLTAGALDDVEIDIPKGGYTPTFKRRSTAAGERGEARRSATPTDADASEGIDRRRLAGRSLFVSARPGTLVLAFIALLAIVGAVIWWWVQDTEYVDTSTAGPTLYVLPFEPTTQDRAELALAKGIVIEIVDRLSAFRGFKVYPVGSAYPLEKKRATGGDVSAFTLDGFVQIVDAEVRITAKLRRTADGLHIWSDRYSEEYTPDRVFDIQDRIARRVIGELAESHGLLGKFSLRELSRSSRPSLRSYECVLLGYQYRASFSRELHEEARDCLEGVVQANSTYARAWSLLAHVYVDEYRFFYNTRPDARRRSVEAARKAAELDPHDALSYQAVSIALHGDGKIEDALTAARKAIELNPHNHIALMQLGYRTFATGRWDEAMQIVDEAYGKTVSPPGWYPWVPALLRIREGDFEAARVLAEAAGLPQFPLFEATRAAIYGQLGMKENAALALERVRQLDPRFDERAREWFAVHQFPEALLGPIMEGLEKAGL
jgi:TolB-like protein/tetratricopeptide (TPR) repeat protein